LRRSAMAVTLATAGLAATAASAQAATLVLTPSSPCHLSGDVITLSGAGFTPNGTVGLTFDGDPVSEFPTDASGILTESFTLQGLRGARSHTIVATDAADPALTASTSFVGASLQVTVKPKNSRAGKKLKLRGYGFLGTGKVYMHVRGHGLRRTVRVGAPAAPCGTWATRRAIVPATAAAGVYRVQFDQRKRFSKKTKPRVRGKMTVTRRFSSAAAFGGARPIYRWTQVG
jgi:hypothetical protein